MSVVDFHRLPTSHIEPPRDLVREILVFFTSVTTVGNPLRSDSFMKTQRMNGLKVVLPDYYTGPGDYYRHIRLSQSQSSW